MGVLECGRMSCENIMCDVYSDKYGYICDDCFEELVYSGPTTDIEKFMESKKTDRNEARARYEAVFNRGV